MTEPLVEVSNLSVDFVTRESTVRAVNDVNFTMLPGEVMCMLGESGSGKSVTMRALILAAPNATPAIVWRQDIL